MRGVLIAIATALVVAYAIDLASGGRVRAEVRAVAAADPPPWMVSQVIEEARRATRQAAERGDG